jgi:uncharacterized protein
VGKIADELRKKFKSPREAIAALGLDESLLDVKRLALDGARKMPTRLEALALRLTARAVNPLLAFDAKVDYSPVFKGLNTGNFKDRKPKIVTDLKALVKGKTLAADAEVNMGHVAKMLDHLEHVAEPKSLDESVSEEQHKAMEAAANGHSNLGIPKDVGKEFSEADKGKTFRDAMPAFLREKGMSEDDIKHCMDMFPGEDEMPENALDESEEEKRKKEAEEKEAKDKKAKDEAEAKEKADKEAKDKGMDKMVTKDAMNAAIKEAVTGAVDTERKNNVATAEARAFVRPWVGELSMALDSAEKVYRGAASALGVKNAEKINVEGLRAIIELQPKPGAHPSERLAQDSAHDSDNSSGFYGRFPDAARITPA